MFRKKEIKKVRNIGNKKVSKRLANVAEKAATKRLILITGKSKNRKKLIRFLGKKLKRVVYRVDFSVLVSKDIRETEKNLDKLFAQAEVQNWILFLDEADALFSKRTDVSDSDDRYNNQDTAYLLEKIEKSKGLVVLSANLRDHIDPAFLRRLQVTIDTENEDEED
jgi:SpoVK/Ycf46/Vps4 family AAA+-type ATPase